MTRDCRLKSENQSIKIKLEELKEQLRKTKKISNDASGVSESNEKKLKLFQYKYERLSRSSRESNLSKQREIETLKANVREFQNQLENIKHSSQSKSSFVRNDLRDILCVLHSVTSQIVDDVSTPESRLAGEMLRDVIKKVNSIMNQDIEEDMPLVTNPLLDDVTASMVKMCQEMEEDSAQKHIVITKLQRALESASSDTTTKMLKIQFDKIMTRNSKRRGILKKHTDMLNVIGNRSSSKPLEESKRKKEKKKRRKKKYIPKPPSNLERRARLREEAEMRAKKRLSQNGRVVCRKQKENYKSSNRNVSSSSSSSSSSPTRRRRNVEMMKPIQRERKISNRVTTRLEDWLCSHVLNEDNNSSSSSSKDSFSENEVQPDDKKHHTSRSISSRKENHYNNQLDVDVKKTNNALEEKKEVVVMNTVAAAAAENGLEDTALQHEISILDQEIRNLKESLESATLALDV